MGWNENVGCPSNELFCLNASDNALIWKKDMEDTANGEYGILIYTVTPEVWGDYLVLCDVADKADGSETGTIVSFIPRDSADGATAVSRRYPHHLKSLLNGNVNGGDLFFSTILDSVILLDLAKAIDPGLSADDCIEFKETLGSQESDEWVIENNIIFTETSYIYVKRNCVTARSLEDNSLLWSYDIVTGLANGVNSVYGNKLFVPTWNGMVYCFDAGSGEVIWTRYLTVKDKAFEANSSMQYVHSRGEIIDGKWYAIVSGSENALFILDLESGEKELCYRVEWGSGAVPLNLFYRDGILYMADVAYVYGLRFEEK